MRGRRPRRFPLAVRCKERRARPTRGCRSPIVRAMRSAQTSHNFPAPARTQYRRRSRKLASAAAPPQFAIRARNAFVRQSTLIRAGNVEDKNGSLAGRGSCSRIGSCGRRLRRLTQRMCWPPKSKVEADPTAASDGVVHMLEFWPIVLTISGLATSGLFARAVRDHFVSKKLPAAMKLLVTLSYLAVFIYVFALWTGGAALWQRIAGLSLQIVAAGLFNWARTTTRDRRLTAAFDTDEPTFLMESGPYRFVRHPFYVSYVVFWVGSSLGGNSLVLYVLCVLLIASYVVAALLEERKFKVSTFAVDYELYAKKTGFFFPKIAALAKRDPPKGRQHP